MDMIVVGISGSTREGSMTLAAVEKALEAAQEAGAETRLIDLRRIKLPIYDPDAEPPTAAQGLLEAIAQADAVILGTPVYHGALSGVLKNALDYLPDLEGKAVAFISIAGGNAGTNAITSLQFVAQALHGISLPRSAAIAGLTPASLRRLQIVGEELVELATRLSAINPVYTKSAISLLDE